MSKKSETDPSELTCLRCGYRWKTMNRKAPPKACPRCKSYRWNEPKVER